MVADGAEAAGCCSGKRKSKSYEPVELVDNRPTFLPWQGGLDNPNSCHLSSNAVSLHLQQADLPPGTL